MRISPPFDPIEVGEIDTFAFDFSRDCPPGVYMLDTAWTCRLTAFSRGWDPDPQSRLSGGYNNSGWAAKSVTQGDNPAQSGQWSVVTVGPMPASAAGADYVLDAVAYLSDGRQVAYNTILRCVLPGQ
jgi:hypothetical protein